VELLGELDRALRGSGLTVVHGLGGVGKTQLVLAWLANHERAYEVVWWVRAEQLTTLASDLVRLAARLRLPEHADPDQQRVVEAVWAWLARHRRWLLVLDNGQDERTLTQVLPALDAGGRVLVTTRSDLWRDAATVEVRPWARAEALAFLRRSLPSAVAQQASASELDALAEELGELPLALEQAAAYLHQAKIPLATYLAAVQERGIELFDLPGEERTVATVWSLSLARLRATSGAEELLGCAPIWRRMTSPADCSPSTPRCWVSHWRSWPRIRWR
jgi:hypothetical protein